ncbi:MAG: nucleotidyltransferase domain-containing protein [Methanomicrobiaceae archaeon]|nr:nucleotidyltransferase domain-containing protein [Methanomicrobiaceae archaeon]
MLANLFTSRTRVRLLTLFLMNPNRRMYVREIVRAIGGNINAVRRELANLEEIGLLSSTREGTSRYYLVNREFPILSELTGIILKTEGLSLVLADRLAGIGGIEAAFIFGSFARGEAGSESDIDLFIVGDVDERLLAMAVREIELQISREINYVLFSPEELAERVSRNDPFIARVLAGPKVMLSGDLHV